ncbi:Ig-like domain-containing protein [Yersinia pekkanenii]|uniref:Invasin n=1 Tax=Yersinia pekkanenii TaxID=1288385 RepID=A0A0T9RL31_9GAMM|nr:inverse autotransporter beta-barrel domain-containing protein [Yersinia pekkanenii]CNI67142.1 invasin [Yersinia pekkanenii]CRY69504.1 invasin [Yersinia pekkanenii]
MSKNIWTIIILAIRNWYSRALRLKIKKINKKTNTEKKSSLLTKIAWTNIVFQLLFPLTISFTPIVTSAAEIKTYFNTVSYTLIDGDSTKSIAEKYNLTLNEFKKINQFRTFSTSFELLPPGTEIDIPDNGNSLNPISTDSELPTDYNESIANNMIKAGTILSAEKTSNSALNIAKSTVTSETNKSVGQWLNQLGTARVQLNIDDDFKLDNSELDLLIPIYDSEASLLFTQLGIRNKDSRNTMNIGAGLRIYYGDWMYGLNTFFDNDMSGNNRRIGLGTEVWTNYLKLSGNGYFGITDWHQSRDFIEYKERPANGYDIRAEAYLPSYPQLGARLMYEKYLGDDVALFGKDNRQKDPYAVTAGVNYTPIPLITIGVDHRAGKNSNNDTTIGLQLTYRLSQSWQSQITPSSVAATRHLSGSRHDLVERNNNIILDYQKQELIRLDLPNTISAAAGESSILTAQVTTIHGTDRIEWEADSLISAGGTITELSKHSITLTYPSYQNTRGAGNTYTLNAVAYDIRGNASNQATTTILVTTPDTIGSLTVTNDRAIANGINTNELYAQVIDGNNMPVSGQSVAFSANNGAVVTANQVITDANGIAPVTLHSTMAGTSLVTASINGASIAVNTTFIADDTTAEIIDGNLTVLENNAIANGSDLNKVQVIVTDAHGNLVAGKLVQFTADNGAMIASTPVETDNDGIATIVLHSNIAGISSVTATINNSSKSIDTVFINDDATTEIIDGNLTIVSNYAVADSFELNSVKAIVTNAQGTPVSGKQVNFTSSNGSTIIFNPVTTDNDGVALTSLHSILAGTAIVTATINNSSQNVSTTFVADENTVEITTNNLSIIDNDATANGVALNKVQALVTDLHGNPVGGVDVMFSADNGAMITATITTDINGIAIATLHNTVMGTSIVVASINNSSQTVNTNFTQDVSDVVITLTPSIQDIVANGTLSHNLEAIVTNNHGDALPGLTIRFTSQEGNITIAETTTDSNGIANSALTSTIAKSIQIIATTGSSSAQENFNFIADEATAEITVNNLTILSDDALADGNAKNKVQAIVTDANNNPVPDLAVHFNIDSGSIASLTLVTNADGTILAEASSNTEGPSIVTASVNGSTRTVTINFSGTADFSNIVVNGETFPIDAGFPRTGFVGANFQIYINNSSNNNDQYIWNSSNPALVTVNNGQVNLIAEFPSGSSAITITAQPIGGGEVKAYSFRVSEWFIRSPEGTNQLDGDAASGYCRNTIGNGYNLPLLASATSGFLVRRAAEGLYAEWGNLTAYSGWVTGFYFARESTLIQRQQVRLTNGDSRLIGNGATRNVMCSRSI